MALAVSDVRCEIREVLLRDKPAAMLEASAKGTVPVLVLADRVIDESLDVIDWALEQNDPDGWRPGTVEQREATSSLLSENDGSFKKHLDCYKYSSRYENANPVTERAQAEVFIARLETLLTDSRFLLGDKPQLADIAIFPFIRQFAGVDREAWQRSSFPSVQAWLKMWTTSPLFTRCMVKMAPWRLADKETYFPPPA